ncbi:MAG: hypothetical protein ACTHOJ_17670 [Sphingomonas oligoaromativorans]
MAESPEAVALELTRLILTGGRTVVRAADHTEENILRVYRTCLAATKGKAAPADLPEGLIAPN